MAKKGQGKPNKANAAVAKPKAKLNYDEVLSEYSKVVSADILKDPYHTILI